MLTNASNGFDHSDKTMLRMMAQVGAARGEDGTGVALVNNKGDVSYVKKVFHPYFMFREKEFEDLILKPMISEGKCFFGHNRLATRGGISDATCHPFHHKHITLIHNGSLTSGIPLPANRVDSDCLAEAIADKGTDVFRDLWGAWTTIWHNQDENTMNFVMNGDRPMEIFKTHKGIFFASRGAMLQWCMAENRNWVINGVDRITWEKDHLYTVDLDAKHLELRDRGSLARRFRHESTAKTRYWKNPVTGNWEPRPADEQKPDETNAKATNEGTTKSTAGTTETSKPDIPSHLKVTFRVAEIVSAKTTQALYRYNCVSVQRESVYFIYREVKPEFMGQWFEGVIDHREGTEYFVRFDTCKFIHDQMEKESLNKKLNTPSAKKTEPEDTLYTFRFKDSSKISKSLANTLFGRQQHKCVNCNSHISPAGLHLYSPVRDTAGNVTGISCCVKQEQHA